MNSFAKHLDEFEGLEKRSLPEFFPWVDEPDPGPLLVGQQPVDDRQAEAVQLVRKPLHHVRPNKFDLNTFSDYTRKYCQIGSNIFTQVSNKLVSS